MRALTRTIRIEAMNVPDYLRQPAAWFHTRILVGPGAFLTPRYAAEHRITHVINCAADIFSPIWWRKHNPNRYVCLNAIDSTEHNIMDWYDKFEAVAYHYLRQPGGGVLYVHCQAGMNRSGFLALAYVCKNFHLPLDGMIATTRRQRPVILQNPVFMNQVKDYLYGRVSGEKNTRLDLDRVHNRDSGLFTSDNRSGSQGVNHNAGVPADGVDGLEDVHLHPLLEQRPGIGDQSQPDGDAGTSH